MSGATNKQKLPNVEEAAKMISKDKIHAGYPTYDQKANVTMIRPGQELLVANGFVNPINTGERTYYICGAMHDVLDYLGFLDSVPVKARQRSEKGTSWVDSASRGVQVVIKASTGDMMSQLSPGQTFVNEVAKLLGSRLPLENSGLGLCSAILGELPEVAELIGNAVVMVSGEAISDADSLQYYAKQIVRRGYTTLEGITKMEKQIKAKKTLQFSVSGSCKFSSTDKVMVELTTFAPETVHNGGIITTGKPVITCGEIRDMIKQASK